MYAGSQPGFVAPGRRTVLAVGFVVAAAVVAPAATAVDCGGGAVSVDAAGHRLKVVVKGGADAERFTRETLASVYWEKEKGKEFRTLTELADWLA